MAARSPTPADLSDRNERAAQVDLAVALVSGPGHWFGEGQRVTTPVLAVGWAQVLSLVGLGTVISCIWLTIADLPTRASALWVTLTWLGVGVLVTPLVLGLAAGSRRRLSLGVSLFLRITGVLLLVAMSTPLLTGWPILLWWPASVFLGTDVSLTMRALGRASDGMAPMSSVLLSPLHLGLLVVVAPARSWSTSSSIRSLRWSCS